MNPATLQIIATAFSMRRELKLIFFTLLALFLIPVFAVLILTQAGIDLVSGSLVSSTNQTPQTANVEIHDPATGQVTDTIIGPAIWPVSGPVTLEFAQSDLPYQPFHTGIDIASPNHQVGDPVAAFMDGTVTYAGSVDWGYGTHVEIDHGHHVTSIYGHLDSLNVVAGQQVKMGDVIGTRGSTGWSTGPHTHFEIRVFGIPVNPRVFLARDP